VSKYKLLAMTEDKDRRVGVLKRGEDLIWMLELISTNHNIKKNEIKQPSQQIVK
jgi:hypothetical protein